MEATDDFVRNNVRITFRKKLRKVLNVENRGRFRGELMVFPNKEGDLKVMNIGLSIRHY